MRPRSPLGLAFALAAAVAFAGCGVDGAPSGDVTFRDPAVPFTFRIAPEFTAEDVDRADTRGDVRAIRALDKVDLIAVRHVGSAALPVGDVPHRILGKAVVSRIWRTPIAPAWALECQWSTARRADVLRQCARARRSLAPARGVAAAPRRR